VSTRPEGAGEGRYSREAWEETRREALAERSGATSPVTLAPGIVKMSLRGGDGDVEKLVAAMRAAGIVVWRGDSSGTRAGNQAGYRYFTVEVPKATRG